MIDALADLTPLARDTLQITFLVFLRVGAAMAVLPGFGEQMIPMRVRLGSAIAFTLICYPMVERELSGVMDGSFVFLSGVEIASGLIMGIAVRLFIHVLQIAGSMAAQSVSLSQLLGASVADPVPAMGQVLVLGGIALALLLGLHIRIAEYLVFSYQLLPPGVVPQAERQALNMIADVARAFALAFSLAAPFVIASLVYNLALGVINRAMPQLMVAFVGAPALTGGGLILFALAAPFMLQIWAAAIFGFLDAPGARF